MDFDWRASTEAEIELRPIVDEGRARLKRGELKDAATIFRATIDAILEVYVDLYDDQGEIGGIVGECCEGLGGCLLLSEDGRERARLIRDLFGVFRWDSLEQGGYGMSEAACDALIKGAEGHERQRIVGWLQEALSALDLKPRRRREVERFIQDLLVVVG